MFKVGTRNEIVYNVYNRTSKWDGTSRAISKMGNMDIPGMNFHHQKLTRLTQYLKLTHGDLHP
eukprot:5829610-Prorocentrum_lima.AAC.1